MLKVCTKNVFDLFVDINYDTSLGGIEIVSASVEADRAGVLLPEATYSRKKRAVTSNNQNINIGTIVNPASSGGTAVITLNVRACSLLVHLSSKGFMYNRELYYVI